MHISSAASTKQHLNINKHYDLRKSIEEHIYSLPQESNKIPKPFSPISTKRDTMAKWQRSRVRRWYALDMLFWAECVKNSLRPHIKNIQIDNIKAWERFSVVGFENIRIRTGVVWWIGSFTFSDFDLLICFVIWWWHLGDYIVTLNAESPNKLKYKRRKYFGRNRHMFVCNWLMFFACVVFDTFTLVPTKPEAALGI